MKITFEEGLHTSRKWCHLIIDALTHADNEDGEEDGSDYGMVFNEEVGSKSTYTSYTDDGMDIKSTMTEVWPSTSIGMKRLVIWE